MAEEKFEEMSLIGHLTELRKRLLWSFLYILLIFIVCFYFEIKVKVLFIQLYKKLFLQN